MNIFNVANNFLGYSLKKENDNSIKIPGKVNMITDNVIIVEVKGKMVLLDKTPDLNLQEGDTINLYFSKSNLSDLKKQLQTKSIGELINNLMNLSFKINNDQTFNLNIDINNIPSNYKEKFVMWISDFFNEFSKNIKNDENMINLLEKNKDLVYELKQFTKSIIDEFSKEFFDSKLTYPKPEYIADKITSAFKEYFQNNPDKRNILKDKDILINALRNDFKENSDSDSNSKLIKNNNIFIDSKISSEIYMKVPINEKNNLFIKSEISSLSQDIKNNNQLNSNINNNTNSILESEKISFAKNDLITISTKNNNYLFKNINEKDNNSNNKKNNIFDVEDKSINKKESNKNFINNNPNIKNENMINFVIDKNPTIIDKITLNENINISNIIYNVSSNENISNDILDKIEKIGYKENKENIFLKFFQYNLSTKNNDISFFNKSNKKNLIFPENFSEKLSLNNKDLINFKNKNLNNYLFKNLSFDRSNIDNSKSNSKLIFKNNISESSYLFEKSNDSLSYKLKSKYNNLKNFNKNTFFINYSIKDKSSSEREIPSNLKTSNEYSKNIKLPKNILSKQLNNLRHNFYDYYKKEYHNKDNKELVRSNSSIDEKVNQNTQRNNALLNNTLERAINAYRNIDVNRNINDTSYLIFNMLGYPIFMSFKKIDLLEQKEKSNKNVGKLRLILPTNNFGITDINLYINDKDVSIKFGLDKNIEIFKTDEIKLKKNIHDLNLTVRNISYYINDESLKIEKELWGI